MKTRSMIWTIAFTVFCCSAVGSAELTPPPAADASASWAAGSVAAAAATAERAAVTADSATVRQKRSPPPPGLTPSVTASDSPRGTASDAPRGTARRSLGGHQASSETAAAAAAAPGARRGPAGHGARLRPPVMLVNRDGELHSLAPVRRAPSAGSGPSRLTEGASAAVGASRRRHRNRRSLLSPPPAVGAGQVLVGLARGPDTPLTPTTPRLTASAFLVQFSEIGGRTSQVVETRGGTRTGERSEGGHVILAQNKGQRGPVQDQRLFHGHRRDQETEPSTRHDPEQGVTQPSVLSEPGRHQFQTGTTNNAQAATALQSQQPAEVSDPGIIPQHGRADSDRFISLRPNAGQPPVRFQYDQRQTQQTASSVTVTESVRPQLRPAQPDQQPRYEHETPDQTDEYDYETPDQNQGYDYETPDRDQGYDYEAPDQIGGYKYETPGQNQGYKYETPDQNQGYKYETPDQNQGYKYETPDQNQGYKYETPDQNQGYKYETPDQNQGYKYETPDQNQGYKYETPDQNQGYKYETPDQNQGYKYETPDQNQVYKYETPDQNQRYHHQAPDRLQVTNTGPQAIQNTNAKLTGSNVFTAPRTHHADGGDTSSTRVFQSSAQPSIGPLAGPPSGFDGSRPARPSTGVPRYNLPPSVSSESAPDANIRPGRGRDQSASGAGLSDGTALGGGRRDGDLGRQPPTGVSEVRGHPAPALSQIGISLGANFGQPISDVGYQYSPPSSTSNGYQYDSPPGTDTGYQYDPSSAVSSGNNPAGGAGVGYQYDPPSGTGSGYQYDPPSASDAGYQTSPAAASNEGYQYERPATDGRGYQCDPPSATDAEYQYDPAPPANPEHGYDRTATGASSVNAISAPEYHVDHWHRPQPALQPSPSNTPPSHTNGWRPMTEQSATEPSIPPPERPVTVLGPSTARPELSPASVGPSTPGHDLPAVTEGRSTARPPLPSADPSPSPADPEFPALRLDAPPSPRGLMWPVLDVLERTMAARMVSAATVGEPDGVVVWHRGTARPPQQEPRRRRRRREVRPGTGEGEGRSAMQHALAMVAALSYTTGTAAAAPRDGVARAAPQTDGPLSQLPLQPGLVIWARSRDGQQSTAADPVSADRGPASASAADGQQSGHGVLPAPRVMTYPDLSPERVQPGVALELDHVADGVALWGGADPAPADQTGSLLDQFPFEPSKTRDEYGKLGFDGIDSAFGGGFFASFPDKPFPLEDVVIPDFYFVDEFDTKENSIDTAGSVETKSSESTSLVVL